MKRGAPWKIVFSPPKLDSWDVSDSIAFVVDCSAALAGYPKISAICASVAGDANIAAYLAGRGKQMF